MMSECFTLFLISGLGETQVIPEYVVFYKNRGVTWKYDVEGKFTGKKEKGCQQTPLQILY